MERETYLTYTSQNRRKSRSGGDLHLRQHATENLKEESMDEYLSNEATSSSCDESFYSEDLMNKMIQNYRLDLQMANDKPLDLRTKQKQQECLISGTQQPMTCNNTLNTAEPLFGNMGQDYNIANTAWNPSYILLLQQQIQEMQNKLYHQFQQQTIAQFNAESRPLSDVCAMSQNSTNGNFSEPSTMCELDKDSKVPNTNTIPNTNTSDQHKDVGARAQNIFPRHVGSHYNLKDKRSLDFITSSPFDPKRLPPVLMQDVTNTESTIADSSTQRNYVCYESRTPYTSLDSLILPVSAAIGRNEVYTNTPGTRIVTSYSSGDNADSQNTTSDFSSTEYECEYPFIKSSDGGEVHQKITPTHRVKPPTSCLPCGSTKPLDVTSEYRLNGDTTTIQSANNNPKTKELQQIPGGSHGSAVESIRSQNSKKKGDKSQQPGDMYWSIPEGENLDETKVVKSCNPGLKLKLLWKRATKGVKKQYNVSKMQIQTTNICRESCLYTRLDDQSPVQDKAQNNDDNLSKNNVIESFLSASVPDGMLSSSAFRYDPDGATLNSDTLNLQNMSVSQSKDSEDIEEHWRSDTLTESADEFFFTELSRHRTFSDLSYDLNKLAFAKETIV